MNLIVEGTVDTGSTATRRPEAAERFQGRRLQLLEGHGDRRAGILDNLDRPSRFHVGASAPTPVAGNGAVPVFLGDQLAEVDREVEQFATVRLYP